MSFAIAVVNVLESFTRSAITHAVKLTIDVVTSRVVVDTIAMPHFRGAPGAVCGHP